MKIYCSDGNVYTKKQIRDKFGITAKKLEQILNTNEMIDGVSFFYKVKNASDIPISLFVTETVQKKSDADYYKQKYFDLEQSFKEHSFLIDNDSKAKEKAIAVLNLYHDKWLNELLKTEKEEIFKNNEYLDNFLNPKISVAEEVVSDKKLPIKNTMKDEKPVQQVQKEETPQNLNLTDLEKQFYDVIEKEGQKFLDEEVMKKFMDEESYQYYCSLTKQQKLKLMLDAKMQQMFPDYVSGKDWDEAEDIKNFDIEEWKVKNAKIMAEKKQKQEEATKKELERQEQIKKELQEELPIPSLSVEANRVEIEICNNEKQLNGIIDNCNNVLSKVKHNRKIREKHFLGTEDLKLKEYDANEIKSMALDRLNYLKNPQQEPQKIEFRWSSAERATNEMWLNEIVQYDELMCQMAREEHTKDLNRYKEALQQGTERKEEFEAKKAFEEEYLKRVTEHENDLKEKRVQFNKDYENRKFGFAEFEQQKNRLEQVLNSVLVLEVDDTNVEKIKNSINSNQKCLEKHLQELKDSITPEGIVFNKYSVAMLYRILNIANGKLEAYENGTEFMEENPTDKIKRAIYSLEDMIYKLTHGNTCAQDDLKIKKEKLYNKLNQKSEKDDRQFVAILCVAYYLVEAHLQASFE